MDIQYINEFVSLARCLSFSEAASENYISQPTLSKHISYLEDMLGITLFKRDKRSVTLTDGGSLFLEDAVRIVSDYNRALERVAMFREGLTHELKIAYLENTRPGNFYSCIKKFGESRPGTKITFHIYHDIGGIYNAVRDGIVDVGITAYTRDLEKHLCYVKLQQIPIGVCLPADDKLAKKGSLKLADIADRKIFMGEEDVPFGMAETFKSRCKEKNIEPEFEYHVRGVNCIGLVALNKGISLFIHGPEVPHNDAVTLVDFDKDEFSVYSVAIWHPENSNPEIKTLVRLLTADK